jgi:3-isopropylmalate dehydrogenase
MFEPVHGSAPDIAGQGVADPTAAILSLALLLHHVGAASAGAAVEAAVSADLATRPTGVRPTRAVGEAIAARAAELVGRSPS